MFTRYRRITSTLPYVNVAAANSISVSNVMNTPSFATRFARRSLAGSVQSILKMKRFSNAVRGAATRSSVDEETFSRWKQAVDGGVSPGTGGIMGNPLYEQEKQKYKARTRSTAGRGHTGRGPGRASRMSRGASACRLGNTPSSLSNSSPLSAPIAEVDDDLENGVTRSSDNRPSDIQL